jgi:hypothetical protein
VAEPPRDSRGGRQRATAIGVVVAGLAAALIIAALALRPSGAELGPILQRAFDDRLRAREADLQARVATLARAPRLPAAVSTDARTVADLTEEELALRPMAGETIVLGQIPRRGTASTPVILRVLPPRAVPAPLYADASAGPRARIVAGRLLLAHGVLVRPLERADELDGVIAASWPVALEDLTRDLVAAGAAAWLQGDGATLALAGTASRGRWVRSEHALASPSGRGLRLVVAAPARHTASYRASAGALALLALLVSWWIWPRRSAGPSPARPGAVPQIASGPSTTGFFPSYLTPSPSPAPILRVGQYEILRLLDAGRTAEVYLARRAGDPDEVLALKVLQSAFARRPEVVKVFLEEARLAAGLVHPNIVRVFEVGQAQDQFFLAMEFVDGADLDRLRAISRRAGRLIPLAVALAVVRRICDGLHAAHTATAADGSPLGLLHRDVKSANVLCARSGSVKIGDFGIARASQVLLDRRADPEQARAAPGALAPEQRLHQPLDRRSDVFGVGAIAYELLSGAPFELDPLALGIERWPQLRLPSALRPDLPAELDQVLLRALAFSRQARFGSCAELAAAVDQIASRHAPGADDETVARWVEATLAADRSGAKVGATI